MTGDLGTKSVKYHELCTQMSRNYCRLIGGKKSSQPAFSLSCMIPGEAHKVRSHQLPACSSPRSSASKPFRCNTLFTRATAWSKLTRRVSASRTSSHRPSNGLAATATGAPPLLSAPAYPVPAAPKEAVPHLPGRGDNKQNVDARPEGTHHLVRM